MTCCDSPNLHRSSLHCCLMFRLLSSNLTACWVWWCTFIFVMGVQILQQIVTKHQKERVKVSPEVVKQFTDVREMLDLFPGLKVTS